MDTIHTIGRRKSAVARIYMSKGKGNITVNNRESDKYFTTATLLYKLNQPFFGVASATDRTHIGAQATQSNMITFSVNRDGSSEQRDI